jgi:hypothetical protein
VNDVTSSARQETSLNRILDALGATLLECAAGDPGTAREVGDLVIQDPHDKPVLSPGALVLAIGVRQPREIIALLRDLAGARAAALVVRAPVQITGEVRRAVAESGIVLLGFTRGAAWTQLAALLRSLLAEGRLGAALPESLGGDTSGDLFAVANAASALLDAPITIEDRSSRVLAFSGNQDQGDESRIETVLGRQVPSRYVRVLETFGVFRRLYDSERPIYLDLRPYGITDIPRVALAVRAGTEILGSIWAVTPEPLGPERERTFCDIAKLVALHILRQRAGADVERRLQAELVATMLEGGAGASEAAERLGLAGRPAIVLALGLLDEPDATAASTEAARGNVFDAFSLHLSAVQPGSAAALIGGVVYGIVPMRPPAEQAENRAEAIAVEFLDRMGARCPGVIGIGRHVERTSGLTLSQRDADRVLRVLRTGRTELRVARPADVQVHAAMLDLGAALEAAEQEWAGPVQRLLDYDAEHNAWLVPTLRAWLDAFGDVNRAAAAVHVHSNTFRYRLRRLAEIGDFDLDDPDARFSAMIQLRLLGAR